MRRVPQQARGQQRVQQLLDSAEALFAEKGYDAVTTNEIAAQAGVSIGSLYQFFGDKQEILDRVMERYRDGVLALYDLVVTPDSAQATASEIAWRMLQPLMDYGTQHLAFTRLILSAQTSPEVTQAIADKREAFAERCAALLSLRFPEWSDDDTLYHAHICLHVSAALLGYAVSEKIAHGEIAAKRIIESTLHVLTGYLERVSIAPRQSSPE
jgi:AcrR family transcriptional regulator